MTKRHKVFVCYHHENDQQYRERFERICTDSIVSWSVDPGDIKPNLDDETIRQIIRDRHLRDSTVTVVLIGSSTWQRKHVDWEIGSSIRETRLNPRSGLLGILLPTYPRSKPGKYNPCTVPPRLYDNIKCGYAEIYNWSDSSSSIQDWIHKAFLDRDNKQPNNKRASFKRNHSGSSWC